MHLRVTPLLLLSLACVENVELGLGTPDAGPQAQDQGPIDLGTDDAGSQDTSVQDLGSPDLGGCAGQKPDCRCGQAVCTEGEWRCPMQACSPCNSDQECVWQDMSFCNNNYSQRTGSCEICPQPSTMACTGGTVSPYSYGNGCEGYTCSCPFGQNYNEIIDACEGPQPTNGLHLDPDTLNFFSLPIGSIRTAVAGRAQGTNTCVTVVFDYSNRFLPTPARCGNFEEAPPYVVLTPNAPPGPCTEWDYGSQHEFVSMDGCVDFEELGTVGVPSINLADFTLTVREAMGGPETVIHVDNRDTYDPRPVSLTLKYVTDQAGEPIFAQRSDVNSELGWLELEGDNTPVPLRMGCNMGACQNSPIQPPACGFNEGQTFNLIPAQGFSGSLSFTWTGQTMNMPTANDCHVPQNAHPRDYAVRGCFGFSSMETGQGSFVASPRCQETLFRYPTDRVEILVNGGG